MSPSSLGEGSPYTSKPSSSDAEIEGILTVSVSDEGEPVKQRPYFITSLLKCLFFHYAVFRRFVRSTRSTRLNVKRPASCPLW